MTGEEIILGRGVSSGTPLRVVIEEGIIRSVDALPATPVAEGVPLDALPWIVPGLVDMQVNGYAGHDFTSAHVTPEDVWAVAEKMLGLGVTRFLPTITTHAHETLVHAVRTIAQAVNEYPPLRECIAGIHLEGPYISLEDGPRGAHPREHVRPPNWDEFLRLQEAAMGLIRLVTLSPEYPETPAFIEKAVAQGVVVAIGHTAASGEQIDAAVAAGARLSTHLGNGCHLTLPRHPNYIWHQLAEDRLFASFIFDGHHLPPEFMVVALRAKGIERSILVSDLTTLAGMPPGLYHTPLGDVELLPEGRLVVAGQRRLLAGAAQPLITGVINAVRLARCHLSEAIAMVTQNPRRLLGLPPAELQPGTPAEFVLLREIPQRDENQGEVSCGRLPSRSEKQSSRECFSLRIDKVYFRGERYPRG